MQDLKTRITGYGVWARGLVALVCVAGVGLAACGGGDKPEPQTDEPGTEVTQDVSEAPGASSAGPLADTGQILREAGFETQPEESSDADAALSAGQVEISYYSDPAQARVVGKQIESIISGADGRGLVEVHGNRLYFIGQERKLTPAEKQEFKKVVSIAEGQ